jgi:streptogramin lyase
VQRLIASDLETGTVTVLEPRVARQGAGRVWSDSRGGLWITGWNSGDLFRYDSKTNSWVRWHLPGDRPQPYAVYVDDSDAVWVSDWGANAILHFDPKTEKFEALPLPDSYASVRQLAGRRARSGEPRQRKPAARRLVRQDGTTRKLSQSISAVAPLYLRNSPLGWEARVNMIFMRRAYPITARR